MTIAYALSGIEKNSVNSSTRDSSASSVIIDDSVTLKKVIRRSSSTNSKRLYDPRTSLIDLPDDFDTLNLSIAMRESVMRRMNVSGSNLREPEKELYDSEKVICEIGDFNVERVFYEAVRSGNVEELRRVISNRSAVKFINEPDWNISGDPPLLLATTRNSLPVLRILLANGCDTSVRSSRGETALHRIIGNVTEIVEMRELVELLLEHDCPVNVRETGAGQTALHALVVKYLGNVQMAKSLLAVGNETKFEQLVKIIQLLAEAGNVNIQDHQGRSVLHLVASSTAFDSQYQERMKILIDVLVNAGADLNSKNDRDETALHECLETGALSTAHLLIGRTRTGIASRYGETPLHIGARKNYIDVVKKLLEIGENPMAQDLEGNTPLHLAASRGYCSIVALLVSFQEVDLEIMNINGMTVLEVAAESGFAETVKILIKAGANTKQIHHYWSNTLRRNPDIHALLNRKRDNETLNFE